MKFRLNKERLLRQLKSLFTVILMGSLVVIQFLDTTPLALLRYAYFDFAQRVLPSPQTKAPITIVEVDEASITAFGQWPWPRDRIAELVKALSHGRPAVVGIALLFREPDRLSPENVLSGLEVSPFILEQLADLPTNDQALAASIGSVPSVLATAAARDRRSQGNPILPRTPIELKLGWSSTPRLTRYPGLLASLPIIESASAGSGIASLELDRDGVIRRLPTIAIVNDSIVPSFAVEVVRVFHQANAIGVEIEGPGVKSLTIGANNIETDSGGNIWLRNTSSALIPRYSAAEILFDRVDAEVLTGRIVLLGTTAVGLTKSFISTGGTTLSALDAQAVFVDNLVSNTYLKRSDIAVFFEVIATLIGCIGIILMRGRLRTFGGQAIVLIYALSLFATGLVLLEIDRIMFDPSFSICSMLLVYIIFIGLEIVATQRERRRTEQARRTALMLAESASQSKTNFLAGMSHELRTPLNAIIGFSEMIKDGVLGPISPPNYANYAKDIHGSAVHLLSLVTQMLDMANLESGERRLRATEFSLAEALEESLETIRDVRAEDRPNISVIDASQLPILRADRRMVNQMLLNLLLNSVKFSRPGEPILISADFVGEGDFSLSVTDGGSGMSPQQVAEAFEIFQASDQTVSDSARGIGLGLPITTAMIEEHGGSLNVVSHKGRGTRMTLTFPADRVVES